MTLAQNPVCREVHRSGHSGQACLSWRLDLNPTAGRSLRPCSYGGVPASENTHGIHELVKPAMRKCRSLSSGRLKYTLGEETKAEGPLTLHISSTNVDKVG